MNRLAKLFTEMNDTTVNHANRMIKMSKKKALGVPLLIDVVMFWLLMSRHVTLYYGTTVPTILLLIIMIGTMVFVGTKFTSWVTLKVYEKYNKLVPTFWYWLLSVVFGVLISIATVAFAGVAMLVIVFVIVFSFFVAGAASSPRTIDVYHHY